MTARHYLRAWRLHRGMTQAELAAHTDIGRQIPPHGEYTQCLVV
jgi:transcriptional regulator with XRE-family HTH domain